MRKLTEQELVAFVRQHYEYLTATDMADETGVAFVTIKRIADRIGVTPITPKQQIVKFILENKDRMSFEKVRRALDIGEQYFARIVFHMGLSKNDFAEATTGEVERKPKKVVEKKDRLTVRDILSGYQRGQHHYGNGADRPSLF